MTKHTLFKHPLCTLTVLAIFFLTFSTAQDLPCEMVEDSNSGEISYECPSLHSCIEGYCVRKELFPLAPIEIVGSVFLMILAGLANAGGIGGGALLSPILLIFFHYSANRAIMQVYGIVFGGAVGNFMNMVTQRDPNTGKPFLNYDLAIACMPLMVLSANLGVLLNRICAPIIIIIGLVMIIIYTGSKVYARAKKQYERETDEKSSGLLKEKSPAKDKSYELTTLIKEEKEKNKMQNMDPALQAVLEEEYQLLPKRKLGFLMLLLLFVLFMILLRGSKSLDSVLGVDYCGFGYWFVYFLGLAGCGYAYYKAAEMINYNNEVKRRNNYQGDKNEFRVTPEIMKRVTPSSLLAGLLAGLLGLGGGTVMGPMLIQLGVGPQALASTAGFFVVQTSLVTLFQSVMSGDVSGEELGFFLGISLIGSFGVSYLLSYMVKKYERPSLILFTLSFVLLLSLIVMPLFGIYKSFDKPEEMFTFHSLC